MDIRVPLACVLVAGGLVGLMMPVISDDAVSGPGDANSELTQAVDEQAQLAALNGAQPASAWNEDVTLNRERDGHFYADVYVDGVPSRMMVDTGASVIALTGADAQAMGLFWDDTQVMPVAQGASGPVYGVNAKLDLVRVGNFEARDVDAVIVPEGLGISLLGQSFLSTIHSVEIAENRMVLEAAR